VIAFPLFDRRDDGFTQAVAQAQEPRDDPERRRDESDGYIIPQQEYRGDDDSEARDDSPDTLRHYRFRILDFRFQIGKRDRKAQRFGVNILFINIFFAIEMGCVT
jgi:hypothetical protein